MIQFSKLRLSGFKSFVDKTEIDIGPGLNGIVGPNGCGKSNLVEALRWVMGGTSAKSFRGGGASMEHVIFAGTAKRPARNTASVQLLLDNSALTAPAPFHQSPEIAVERQIQRDKGSTYRVNGKTVRARDVQTLFADSLTGANSPALVSQGRITKIIEAKPHERRVMLEESAGVAGLFTRRREAELRLKAAEENRQRAEDQTASLNQSLAHLKRQAKQAIRYRELGQEIRTLDLAILWHGYHHARNRQKDISTQYDLAEQTVQQAMILARQKQTALGKIQATLPKLREDYAALVARAQKTHLTLQRLVDQEEAEKRRKADQDQALQHIAQEFERLDDAIKGYEGHISTLQAQLSEQEEKAVPYQDSIEKATATMGTLTEDLIALERAYDAYEESRILLIRQQEKKNAITARLETVKKDRKEAQDSLQQLLEQDESFADIETLKQDLASLQTQYEAHNKQKHSLAEDLAALNADMQASVVTLRTTEQQLQAKNNEINQLKNKINSLSEESDGVVADLSFDSQFSEAVQAAFGEDGLGASLDTQGNAFWQNGHEGDLPDLPACGEPLGKYVSGPDALSIILRQTLLVDDFDVARAALPQLSPGQAVVTRTGDIIRHDGLHRRAASQTGGQAAFLLEEKQRLSMMQAEHNALQTTLESSRAKLAAHEAALEKAKQVEQASNQHIEGLNKQIRGLEDQIRDREALHQTAKRDSESARHALARIEQSIQMAERDRQGLEETILTLKSQNDAPSPSREDITAKREAKEDQQQTLLSLQNGMRDIESQTHRIRAEISSQQQMLGNARTCMQELQARKADILAAQRQDTQADPAQGDHGVDQEALAAQSTALDKQVEETKETIAEIEAQERTLNTESRDADAALSDAREARALLSAEMANAREQFEALTSDINENYAFTPQQLEEAVIESFADQVPDQTVLKTQREQMIHRRESLGAVNLRAEEEAQALEEELAAATKDIEELGQAITQLHQGISKLNSEARTRMVAAFDQANTHFRDLFTRLFEGGDAHLKWVDSDDPLSAGLEIEAQPPGKALQSLSLLSGGEQTLTATALIFGMFLSSPSPICVLDEIDAPLDDGNVGRVCDLLEHLARTSHTRFLIITHHRMTMARMDRLYGVTMAENGVSKLVSVDLNDHRQMSMLSDEGPARATA